MNFNQLNIISVSINLRRADASSFKPYFGDNYLKALDTFETSIQDVIKEKHEK